MTIARWGIALLLGLFLIAMGAMKFTGAHIFQYIAFRSGLDLFHPAVNHLVGAAEIVAGALILYPRTRAIGGALGLGVIGGAILFHLSPWLGVSTPAGFADGAAAPWDAGDFSAETSPVLFIIALVMGAVAAVNLWLERDGLAGLLGGKTVSGGAG